MLDRIAGVFASYVATHTDEQLGRLMAGPLRRPLVWGVFLMIPRRLDPDHSDGEHALVELRVADRRRRPDAVFHLLINGRRCQGSRSSFGEPDTSVRFDPVAFLRFCAGMVGARALFSSGAARIEGSLMLALQLPWMFVFPKAAPPIPPPSP